MVKSSRTVSYPLGYRPDYNRWPAQVQHPRTLGNECTTHQKHAGYEAPEDPLKEKKETVKRSQHIDIFPYTDFQHRFFLTVNMFDYLSVCLSVRPSVRPSIRLSVCLSVYPSVCLSVYPSVCLSVYPSVCLSIRLSVCLSVYPSVCLSVYPSVCLSICLSLRLSVCLSIRLSVHPSILI